jgi:hypothetical protein
VTVIQSLTKIIFLSWGIKNKLHPSYKLKRSRRNIKNYDDFVL